MKLRDLSIGRKLRLVMMATSAASLLLACVAFVTVDIRTFRAIRIRDTNTLADITALTSAKPLVVHDVAAACEVLGALKAKPSIRTACIFDLKGRLFAWYDRSGVRHFQPRSLRALRRLSGRGEHRAFRDITLNGRVVGTLYMSSDTGAPLAHHVEYAIAVATILLVSLLLAFFVSSGLQRLISAPIKQLAQVANEVTREKNYARRMDMEGNPRNEIGKLIIAFNEMLAEIEHRDSVLERVVAERTEELRATILRKRLILNSAAEGIVSLDSDGVVTLINKSAAHMLGRPVHELVGRRLHDIVHAPDARNESLEACLMCSATLEPPIRTGKRTSLVDRDGVLIPVEYTASTVIDPHSSKPSGVVVTFRDITERLAVDRMKDEFISTVSHELRTPLTSIRGSLGLLASGLVGNITDRGQKMLDIAVTNADRLVRLINDILDLERLDAGRVELNRSNCDAADLIATAIDSIHELADRAGVRIEAMNVNEALWVDDDRIVQTLTNLLGNAVKFSATGSTVRVSGRSDGETFMFVVEDDGRGIPPSHLESIFERFKQVDSSDSRNKNGTGLGLAICKSIVAAHGGRIWAESVEGQGTTFRFTVPLQPAQTTAPQAA